MVIAPIRWSGEAFVNFAAKTHETSKTSETVWLNKDLQPPRPNPKLVLSVVRSVGQ